MYIRRLVEDTRGTCTYVGWSKTLGGHVCSVYHIRFHKHPHSPIRGVPIALVLL